MPLKCETCKDLVEYINRFAPDKCMIQQARGEIVSDEEMNNYSDVAAIWINHWASHEGNF